MNSNWSYSPETLNSGKTRRFFGPRDLEIWRTTSKNNRAPLLYHYKVYHFVAICEFQLELQSGNHQFVSKLAFFVPCDPDLRLFTWTLLSSRAITPENSMLIRWKQHGEKKCDRQADRQTKPWSQPKRDPCYHIFQNHFNYFDFWFL